MGDVPHNYETQGMDDAGASQAHVHVFTHNELSLRYIPFDFEEVFRTQLLQRR